MIATQTWAKMSCSGPAGEIEQGAVRQEVETGLGQRGAALAREADVELLLQRVEIAHVGGGIILLRVAELGRAPVRALLLLGDFLAEQFADQILEAVPVGIGADQPRGGLGAIDRRRHDAEIGLDRGEVEAGEMVELEPRRIGEHGACRLGAA